MNLSLNSGKKMFKERLFDDILYYFENYNNWASE